MSETNSWLTSDAVDQLRHEILVTRPELKQYLNESRPDVVMAIENRNMKAIQDFVTDYQAFNPHMEEIKSLADFIVTLRRTHLAWLKENERTKAGLPIISCLLNGHKVRGLIDTGALNSLISKKLAKKCKISHLIDERFAAKAVGIGEQEVIGKIHGITLEISSVGITTNLAVVNSFHSNYFIIGQDFLAANNCVVYCRDGIVFFKDKRIVVKIDDKKDD